MKKILATAIITGLIGGSAFAQTNVVSSANVVGYNQITIPSNFYVLVALSFDNPSNTVSSLFGNLPTGSEVLFWNASSQSYTTVGKSRTGWGTAGSNVLTIGSGAFVKVPTATNIYFSGDVPTVSTTVLYTADSGAYKILSYPYPVDMPFTNTALAKGSATGDEISIWTTNGWVSYGKSRTGWGIATNLQIKVGQAILYKTSTTNRPVNEVKPYTID